MARACPTCGGELTYIEKYDRWYCREDKAYAPEGYGEGGNLRCPDCGKTLSYIEQYGRYYCHADAKYMPSDFGKEAATAETPVTRVPEAHAPEEASAPGEAELATELVGEGPGTMTAPPVAERVDEPNPEGEGPTGEETPSGSAKGEPSSPPEPKEPSAERTPLERSRILKAKKSVLVGLCKEYDLDHRGTKDVLKKRLLEYLDDQEIEREEEVEEEELERAEEALKVAPVETEAVAEAEPEEGTREPVVEVTVEEPIPEVLPAEEVAVEVRPEEPETPPEAVVLPEEPPAVENPCPRCGAELVYIDRHDRYWCPAEGKYAPPIVKLETVPAPPVEHPCPTCGKDMIHIAKYDRWYCYAEGRYAPLGKPPGLPEAPEPPAVARPAAAPPRVEEIMPTPPPREAPRPEPAAPPVTVTREENRCPTCGGELSHIEKYDRWYCYSCKQYAPPRVKNPCPTCGKELSFIPTYQRWYCYAEGKYAPKDYLPARVERPAAAVASATTVTPVVRPVVIHKHGSPIGAVVLAALGLVVFILVQGLVVLPRILAGAPLAAMSAELEASLDFLWKLLFGLAIVAGALSLRSRK